MDDTLFYHRDPHGGVPLFKNQWFFLQAFDVVDELGMPVVDIRDFFRESVDLLINRIVICVQLFLMLLEVFASRPGSLRNPRAV